jgi:hypothetical protein
MQRIGSCAEFDRTDTGGYRLDQRMAQHPLGQSRRTGLAQGWRQTRLRKAGDWRLREDDDSGRHR